MASQPRKNPHCAEPIPAGTTASFAELPEELLLNILQHADIPSVLRLRETSKSFVPACTEAIRDKAKILYIHPSSVERAISICQSDLSSKVGEVCFVSKNFHVRLDHDLEYYSAGPAGFPWPVREPLEAEVEHKGPWGDEHAISKFQKSYRRLLSSLAVLKITAFSFREACDQPGFNMISAQRITSWRKSIEPDVPSEECKAESNFPIPHNKFQFADIDALAAVLADSRFKFAHLKISHELAYEGCGPSLGMSYIGHHRTLTHVELAVSHGFLPNPWEHHYGDFLSSTASTLIELKLGFQYQDPTPIVHSGHKESSFICIFYLLELPKLQRLELRRFPAPDSKAITAGHSDNAVMLQHIDLGHFLRDRCPKLQFLQLVNVVPVLDHQWPPKPWTMADIVLQDFDSVASEIRGLNDGTRAWNIDFSA